MLRVFRDGAAAFWVRLCSVSRRLLALTVASCVMSCGLCKIFRVQKSPIQLFRERASNGSRFHRGFVDLTLRGVW